jgi:transposase-like protein
MNQPSNGSIFVDTEVPAKAKRRSFTAAYKLRILEQADRCTEPGEIGALLRREGLYSSHLAGWREAREKGALSALSKKRGRTPKESPDAKEIGRLRRENERLREKLRRAETVIDVQKKVSEILGVDLPKVEDDDSD